MFEVFVYTAFILFVYVTAVFVLSVIKRDMSIIDIAWGLGVIVVAEVIRRIAPPLHPRELLLMALTALWGVRLALHITVRHWGKDEDFRYKQMRDKWGAWVLPRSYVQVFLFQGLLLLVLSSPMIVVGVHPSPPALSWYDAAGIALWSIGFFFEVVGDYQLQRFRSDPSTKGKIMKSGLWRYTRHPNYFGEVVLWWGIWLIALPTPGAVWTVVSPVEITIALLVFTGIPMLEKKYEGNAEYEAYKQNTNAFFPWFPKKSS